MKKIILLPLLTLLLAATPVLASEVHGTLTTGISGNNGSVVEGVVISAPIATPNAGSYTEAQNVTLTASGATSIHYTIDGTAPTCTTGTVYSAPISVAASLVIEAMSCYPNDKHSTPASYLYAINMPAPADTSGSTGGGGGGGGGGSTSTTNIRTDANNDGKVDILDFIILMVNWNKNESGNPADFNNDNSVNIFDFVALMANWTA